MRERMRYATVAQDSAQTLGQSLRVFARVRFVISVLLVMLSFGVVNDEVCSQGADVPPDYTLLLEEAQTVGHVRVLVVLDVPFHPVGTLSKGQALSQRRTIADGQDALLERLAAEQVRVNQRYTYLPGLALTVDASALSALQRAPEVVTIEVDRRYKPSLDVSVPLIGANTAWDMGYTGAGWAVAVLDTGVDKSHAFLSGKVVSEACYSTSYTPHNAMTVCPGGGTDEVGSGTGVNCATSIAGCEHGTHVAGIAAGYQSDSFAGVAKEGSVIAIQVFSRIDDMAFCDPYPSPCVTAYTSDIIKGLERVLALHNDAGFTTAIASVNLSLGGGSYTSSQVCDNDNSFTKLAIDNLVSVGVATIVASGNEGYVDALSSPACISSAISVGATSDSDVVTDFSNSANFLDLLAPGASIYSSVPGGGFESWPGTSMATPHVAGAWAVLKSANPGAGIDTILDALKKTGVSVTDSRNGLTKPRIQVGAAVDLLAGSPAIQVSPEVLVSTQPPNVITYTAMSVINSGTSDLVWDTNTGDANASMENLIIDGGFEGGISNPNWSVPSGVASPICSLDTCGMDAAYTGDWFARFGDGTSQKYGIEQTVTVPPASEASLSFWLRIDQMLLGAGTLDVMLDGTILQSFNESDAATYSAYRQVAIDVSGYADGGAHTLRFEGQQTGSLPLFSAFVDDVSLVVPSAGGGECHAVADIAWLSLSPDAATTQASGSTHVNVAWDSNGLASGMYTDTLCVSSNDPDRSQIHLPVRLNVVSDQPANHTPTDILLHEGRVYEGQPAGTRVGTLSTVDPDAGDVHTYTLVSGAGDTDNALFQIDGEQLETAGTLDAAVYSVRVRTDDGAGGTFEKPFTLSILAVLSDGTLRVSPPDLYFTATLGYGDPETQSLSISFATGKRLVHSSYAVGSPLTFIDTRIAGSFSPRPPVYRLPSTVNPLDYPSDPTADIEWSGGTSGVGDIQAAFNNARTTENTQLGTSTPLMTLPDQATWDGMSIGEKALWLINRERVDRGVAPLHGVESNVTSVAQAYAQYLLDNDAWGHQEDGRTPWQRLEANPSIGACHDFLNVAENLAVFVTSGTSISLPVERAIYMWMYKDSGSNWGHRHAILWYPYNDNSGPTGQEGFLGLGRAGGGPYQGPFSQPWNYAELIVMNVFDPCATWDYGQTNQQPTDIILSNARVEEDLPVGTSVGTFNTVDPDPGDTHTYTLVDGAGAADNDAFTIDDAILRTAEVFDYATQDVYHIRVQTDDGQGGTYQEPFVITVTQAASNRPPTNIKLSSTSVLEGQPVGTAVGTFSATDPDEGDTHTYILVAGPGDADNDAFTIDGDTLKTAEIFVYATQSVYYIRVQAEDSNEGTYQKPFTITVMPEGTNRPPTDINISSTRVLEGQPAGAAVGTFSTVDPDVGDTYTYTLVSGAGDAHNGAFTIDGDLLKTAEIFTYTMQSVYNIRVQTEDQEGETYQKPFTITVIEAGAEAWTISHATSVMDWLSVAPDLGNGADVVDVSVSVAGLDVGQYAGVITVTSGANEVVVDVTLTLQEEVRVYLPLVLRD